MSAPWLVETYLLAIFVVSRYEVHLSARYLLINLADPYSACSARAASAVLAPCPGGGVCCPQSLVGMNTATIVDRGCSLTGDDDELAVFLLASKPGKSVQHPVIDTTIAVISVFAIFVLPLLCLLFQLLLFILPFLLPLLLLCGLLVATIPLFAAPTTKCSAKPSRPCSQTRHAHPGVKHKLGKRKDKISFITTLDIQ